MGITVNTNTFSLSAQRNVSRTQSNLSTAMQRLSSGLRINSAKDDAAGLAVASKMETQARGQIVAQRNIGDGSSALQVADNTLQEVSSMLQRMRELSVQAASGTYNASQKAFMSIEAGQLNTEISNAQGRALFNGTKVMNWSANIQAGANNGETMTIATSSIAGLAANKELTLSAVDAKIGSVNSQLAKIGSYQSRLDKALNVSTAIEEAQWSARGRIIDADFARETSRMTSAQVVQQAGISALAQANSIPQLALGLLG